MACKHIPVLLEEVLRYLDPRSGQILVDGTFGFGGHGLELARRVGKKGKIIAIEKDSRTLKEAKKNIPLSRYPQVMLRQGNFAHITDIVRSCAVEAVDGVLLDLGVNSYQLDSAGYGISIKHDDLLDMRIDKEETSDTALDIIRRLNEKELADLLFQNADEYRSRRIASLIKRNITSINSSGDLARIIASAVSHRGKIHPATKTFQALRVAVNNEFENLEQFFQQIPAVLNPGGRVAVISFHSLEDRIVKNNFKKEPWVVINKKPITPGENETKSNPRARSAKMRVATKN
ncbi:16S rRNA (cytosine(1402)-N(4))-methyltransferase RsmH [Patescibacteria group bacterium]|nr:16S rRNA (cytosine(1402)-N(4))-methyltransferase RsmH [Patescibacteria group bacterium]